MPKTAHRSRKQKSDNTPSVGIFFAVGDKLWIDSTPVPKSGTYGEFRIHECGHDEYWELLIRQGAVPPGTEYQDYPRGRVAYNARTQQFSLLADRCILRKDVSVAELIQKMDLPVESTITGTDHHYRCANCLRKEG